MRPVLFALSLVLLGACHKGTPPTQEPSKSPDTPAADTSESSTDESVEQSPEAKVMHERFLAVNSIRDAVIAGTLATVQERANKLATDGNLRRVLADWGQYTKELQNEVKETAESSDLQSAAMHTAAAADTCGRCHESLGVATLDETTGPPPVEADDLSGTMRRHRWAINRMWDGLVAPSASSWEVGAKALAEATSHAQEQPQVKHDKELLSLLGGVDKLAIEATEAVTGPERTQALGQLLTTCSTCHQKMRPGAGASNAGQR